MVKTTLHVKAVITEVDTIKAVKEATIAKEDIIVVDITKVVNKADITIAVDIIKAVNKVDITAKEDTIKADITKVVNKITATTIDVNKITATTQPVSQCVARALLHAQNALSMKCQYPIQTNKYV